MIRNEVKTTVSFDDFDVVFSTCDDGAALDRRPSKQEEPTEVVMYLQCGPETTEVMRLTYPQVCSLDNALSMFVELIERSQQ